MLYDTHAHLYLEKLANHQDEAVELFERMGGKYINNIAVDLSSSQTCVQLAQKYTGVCYATVGIHPTTAQEMTQEQIDLATQELEGLISSHRNSIVAVGEIGQDHHWLTEGSEEAQIDMQKYAFKKQVLLAQKHDLPVVIHMRDCGQQMIDWIQETGIQRFVLHCFSESHDIAQKALTLSAQSMLSFTCNITYPKSEYLRNIIQKIPLERIMIETDCPYLLPQRIRGKQEYNEPSNVLDTLATIQELRPENNELIEKTIFENSTKFFSLS